MKSKTFTMISKKNASEWRFLSFFLDVDDHRLKLKMYVVLFYLWFKTEIPLNPTKIEFKIIKKGNKVTTDVATNT